MFRWQRYKLFLVSLHISSLFCCFALCKDEFRVEILVKGNGYGYGYGYGKSAKKNEKEKKK